MEAIRKALWRRATYTAYVHEALGLARLAARYPGGILDAALRVDAATCRPDDTPIVLVHGYGHNRSGWCVLERHLRAAGFAQIHTVNYNPLTHDIPAIAAQVRDRVELLCQFTGAERVHLIGHSLGGVVLRWYVQELGGDRRVDTAITVASPHEGTFAAFAGLAVGGCARQLLPGSAVVRRLRTGARPSDVRWVAYYSNIDLMVQPAPSAMIRPAALHAKNVLLKDHAHISMILSPRLARSIVTELQSAASGDAHAPDAAVAAFPSPGTAVRAAR